MDYCSKEYMDMLIKLRQREAQMEAVQVALVEYIKRLEEVLDTSNDICQETQDEMIYMLQTISDVLDRQEEPTLVETEFPNITSC